MFTCMPVLKDVTKFKACTGEGRRVLSYFLNNTFERF